MVQADPDETAKQILESDRSAKEVTRDAVEEQAVPEQDKSDLFDAVTLAVENTLQQMRRDVEDLEDRLGATAEVASGAGNAFRVTVTDESTGDRGEAMVSPQEGNAEFVEQTFRDEARDVGIDLDRRQAGDLAAEWIGSNIDTMEQMNRVDAKRSVLQDVKATGFESLRVA